MGNRNQACLRFLADDRLLLDKLRDHVEDRPDLLQGLPLGVRRTLIGVVQPGCTSVGSSAQAADDVAGGHVDLSRTRLQVLGVREYPATGPRNTGGNSRTSGTEASGISRHDTVLSQVTPPRPEPAVLYNAARPLTSCKPCKSCKIVQHHSENLCGLLRESIVMWQERKTRTTMVRVDHSGGLVGPS